MFQPPPVDHINENFLTVHERSNFGADSNVCISVTHTVIILQKKGGVERVVGGGALFEFGK